MAYIPTEWETGDIITAEKLNNIEDGIVANDSVIFEGELVTSNGTDYTFRLTSGNVEDLALKPNIYMKAVIKRVTEETESTMADVLLKLYAHAYDQGNPVAYVFSAIVVMSSHVHYAQLTYVPSYPLWNAEVKVLD